MMRRKEKEKLFEKSRSDSELLAQLCSSAQADQFIEIATKWQIKIRRGSLINRVI